jgi:hypothetical protein
MVLCNLYQSLSCASMISHMSCLSWLWPYLYYLYGAYFVCEIIYEMQRCLYSWCMSRCICYPIAYSNQASMLGHVWNSWSDLVVSLGKWQKSLGCYGFYLSMIASLGRRITSHKHPVIERMSCLQGCICVLNIMLQYFMQYSVSS